MRYEVNKTMNAIIALWVIVAGLALGLGGVVIWAVIQFVQWLVTK